MSCWPACARTCGETRRRRATPWSRPGSSEIDLANRLVTVGGAPVALTPTEWNVLALLVRNRPKLLTHGTILREVWGPGYSDDSQVLRQQVANLRAKIEPGPGPARAVVTVPRVGYRFAGS